MTLPRTVGEVLDEHTTLEVESIDRMYLNVYVPPLQYDGGMATFFRKHRGHPFASSVLMAPISQAFIAAIEAFVTAQGVPLITFAKGQRKDDVMAAHLARFRDPEGVLFVGKAQEKATVFRTEKRRNPQTGQPYPWLVRSTAMVNQHYFYAVGRDFGPFFLKFCSYFPYNPKLSLNGHEYLKRQLTQRGIAYEALDNGIRSCAAPAAMQRAADGLSAGKIEALLHKWFGRLPHPFGARDRRAGYRDRCSILQSEFSLTQALDQPVTGRMFFGRMTYHLRRLRLHGLIERVPRTHRYHVTAHGLRIALFFTRAHERLFRPGLAAIMPDAVRNDSRLRRAFEHLERAMDHWCEQAKLAA